MRVAEDFANIFDNVEEVLSEARQGVKPDSYLPAKNSKHRAPTTKNGATRGKKNTGRTSQKVTKATDTQLTVQCIKAMTIMGL